MKIQLGKLVFVTWTLSEMILLLVIQIWGHYHTLNYITCNAMFWILFLGSYWLWLDPIATKKRKRYFIKIEIVNKKVSISVSPSTNLNVVI